MHCQLFCWWKHCYCYCCNFPVIDTRSGIAVILSLFNAVWCSFVYWNTWRNSPPCPTIAWITSFTTKSPSLSLSVMIKADRTTLLSTQADHTWPQQWAHTNRAEDCLEWHSLVIRVHNNDVKNTEVPSPALYLVWQCYAYSQYKVQKRKGNLPCKNGPL